MRRTLLSSAAVAAAALLHLAAACGDDGGAADDDDDVIDASVTDGPEAIDAAAVDGAAIDAPELNPADAAVATCTPVNGTTLATEVVATGLVEPLFAVSPPGDARLFVVEQPGRIRIVTPDGDLLDEPFLDITTPVRATGNEQGLLGLAFHPDYATNGRLFVNYTAESPRGDTVIAEYTVSAGNPDVADDTNEQRLLVIDQPYTNHNGGMLAFGPDGYLYISTGDGGLYDDPGDRGEDTTTLLGKILRIDVDAGAPYGIPAGNPFHDSPDGPNDDRPEILHWGLRNPWRFSFDSGTGDLYIADVGQNRIEEVDVAPAGATGLNFGWDTMEGSDCFEPSVGCSQAGRVLPIAEYDHGGGRCSITGGYVYRGTCSPDIDGWYFYADLCSNQVWMVEYAGGDVQNEMELGVNFGSTITSFGQDATGEIYVVNRNGTIRRIVAE